MITFLASGAVAAQAAGGEVNHTFWYLSRAAGVYAYVVLVANMALGLALSMPLLERWVMKWRIFDLHQFTGLLVVGLLALHVFALLGDQYLGYTIPQLLVPFLSPYRPLPIALGVLGFYLTLVVTFTFYVRPQIGQRTWRVIHYGSFAVFALGLRHGILSGTDTGTTWAIAIYGLSAVLVGGLTWWRFSTAGTPAARRLSRICVAPLVPDQGFPRCGASWRPVGYGWKVSQHVKHRPFARVSRRRSVRRVDAVPDLWQQ